MASTGGTRTGPVALRGLLLVCASAVIWGTIGPAVDVVDQRTSLSVLTTGADRALVAVAALGLAVAGSGRLAASRALVGSRPARVVAVGVSTATFQVLFFVAVVQVGVSVATVVCLGFAPVLLLAVGALRLRRAPRGAELATVATAVVGLLLVSLAGGGTVPAPHPVLGVLAALGSGAAFALSAETGAALSRDHDGLVVAFAVMTVAGVVLVAGGAASAVAGTGDLTTSDPVSWGLIGYLGVVTMGLAYVLLFVGLRTTPSGSVVIATLLEPVTAVVIAVALLGERLTPAAVVGTVLILAAITGLGRRGSGVSP